MARKSNRAGLPRALTDLENFRQLTEREAKLFESRFEYVGQILDSIDAWLTRKDRDFRDFLDNLELDLSVNQNLPTDLNKKHTSYLIHTSWTFDVTIAEMRQSLPADLATELDREIPPLDCSIAQFDYWLSEQTKAIDAAISGLYAVTTAAAALTLLTAIDILLGKLLVGSYKARLNPRLLQET